MKGQPYIDWLSFFKEKVLSWKIVTVQLNVINSMHYCRVSTGDAFDRKCRCYRDNF